MKRIPIFGWGVNAYSAYVSRQRRLNCFYEIRMDKDKQALILRGTPGMTARIALPSQPIRGWHVANNILYVVAGSELFSIGTNLVVTLLGTLNVNTGQGNVSLKDNGVQLLIVDGVVGYIYTIVTGSYAQAGLNAAGSFGVISDANFPNGATSVAFMDGRLIVNRPNSRQYYVSQQYDGTGWTNSFALPTFATKDNASDQLSAVVVLGGVLILFGQQSTEFWQDVGSSPLPFARVNGATKNVGLAARYSLAFIGDALFFLSQNLYGGFVEVSVMQGMNIQRVSTIDIEQIIDEFLVWQDAVGFCYSVDGHKMYQLTFPSAQKSFLYDMTTDFWSELQSGLGLTGRHIAQLGITFNGEIYVSDSTSNNIYTYDDELFTENGMPVKRQFTTRHIEQDGNQFGIDELYLDMETGVGLQTGQGSDPQIMLQVSKDGGRTFGTERWKSYGKVGQYKYPRVIWNRLGAARDFVFQWTTTESVKFVVVGGSIKIRGQEGQDG